MIYLPASTRRTTAALRYGAWAAGGLAVALAATTTALHAVGVVGMRPGALYAATGISAGVAAMLAVGVYVRRLIASAVTAACADRAATMERLDRQSETLLQVVAELARTRATVRDANTARRAAEAERSAELARMVATFDHFVNDELPLILVRVRGEGERDGELRGFARGLAAAREMGGD